MFDLIVSFFSYSRNGYFLYLLCSKGENSKCRLTRVTFFLCSACCHMVLYICETFHNNISNGFQLIERTYAHGGNGYVQHLMGNNSNIGKPELRFICSTSC